MRAPWYRDIQSAEIPEFTTPEGVTARVIAGASHGVDGAMQREITEPLYLDLAVSSRRDASRRRCRRSHNAFVYVYRGGVADRRHARAGAADGDSQERRRQRWRGAARATQRRARC